MPNVERVDRTSLLRGVLEQLAVGTPQHARLERRLKIDAADAKRFDQIAVHGVFIEVEADLYRCVFVWPSVAWCSQ